MTKIYYLNDIDKPRGKLTLSLDKNLIDKAHRYNFNISKMTENMLLIAIVEHEREHGINKER